MHELGVPDSEPAGTEDAIAFFRGLPLALALSLLCWALLAAFAWGVYLLVA
jgi:hypothetical protein